MDKIKEQTVSNIVELLKKEQGTERAREYENQLLDMFGEQERNEIKEVFEGRKLPSLLSDTIAKRIFSTDSHKERLTYLKKNVVQDDSTEVKGSYTNEGLMQSKDSKKISFDEPAQLEDGRHSDTEFQISLQEYIFRRAEVKVYMRDWRLQRRLSRRARLECLMSRLPFSMATALMRSRQYWDTNKILQVFNLGTVKY